MLLEEVTENSELPVYFVYLRIAAVFRRSRRPSRKSLPSQRSSVPLTCRGVFRMAAGEINWTRFLTLLLPPILLSATSSTGMFQVEREVHFFTTPGTWMMFTTGTALLFVVRRGFC
jgi:hypothetical protein